MRELSNWFWGVFCGFAAFASLLTGVVCPGEAQAPPATYPSNVDVGVAGITLNYRQSSQQVLGENFTYQKFDTRTRSLVCKNQDATEALELVHHEGRGQNSFQEFHVRFVDEPNVDSLPVNSNLTSSISTSSVSVGNVAATDLVSGASSSRGKEAKDCVIPVAHFKSARDVALGQSLSEITSKFGSRFRIDTQGSITILTYSIETNLSSLFLEHYKALSYYGRYYFKKGRLIQFSFGIDNL